MTPETREKAKEWVRATHEAGETIEVVVFLREALAALEAAEKKLPCGHHPSCEEDDHCMRPEHRYCQMCSSGKCWRELENEFEKMMDAKDVAEKRATDAEEREGKLMERIQKELGYSHDDGERDIFKLVTKWIGEMRGLRGP